MFRHYASCICDSCAELVGQSDLARYDLLFQSMLEGRHTLGDFPNVIFRRARHLLPMETYEMIMRELESLPYQASLGETVPRETQTD
jgi:hypothetical protein